MQGYGRSKKDAEQDAAKEAVIHIEAVAPFLGLSVPDHLIMLSPSTLSTADSSPIPGGSLGSESGQTSPHGTPTTPLAQQAAGTGFHPRGGSDTGTAAAARPTAAQIEEMGVAELRAALLASVVREERQLKREERLLRGIQRAIADATEG